MLGSSDNKVNQSNSRANVIIGRDANLIAPAQSIIDKLNEKLSLEIDEGKKIAHIIESLRYYHEKYSEDGIEGLEQKLNKAGMGAKYKRAVKDKELFVMLLEKYNAFESAQEIFATLLAKMDYCYNNKVYIVVDSFDSIEFNNLFDEQVMVPIMQECVSGVFTINHRHAMGMFYWLAEQCFVRWHR
ncbi:ABC-three component system protein [Asticcacaulis sp.]|uniref:ABC-three component system protein n=1 Tax=Asticcacaulis sp. TaxID=1872648 RepID=UPI002624F39B|nr:ABC-three component system protein [Asticcacaulis sp.]